MNPRSTDFETSTLIITPPMNPPSKGLVGSESGYFSERSDMSTRRLLFQ
jgi:hypothetical protein